MVRWFLVCVTNRSMSEVACARPRWIRAAAHIGGSWFPSWCHWSYSSAWRDSEGPLCWTPEEQRPRGLHWHSAGTGSGLERQKAGEELSDSSSHAASLLQAAHGSKRQCWQHTSIRRNLCNLARAKPHSFVLLWEYSSTHLSALWSSISCEARLHQQLQNSLLRSLKGVLGDDRQEK